MLGFGGGRAVRLMCVCAVVFAAGLLVASPAYAADVVVPPGDITRTLDSKSSPVVIPLVFTDVGATAGQIGVVVRDITLNNASIDPRVATAQLAPDTTPGATKAANLEITLVDPQNPTKGDTQRAPQSDAQLPQQGNYQLLLLLTASGGNSQELKVTLTRPAAVLDTGVSLTVRQTVGWNLPIDPDASPPLQIAAESGALLALNAMQKEGTPGQITVSAKCLGSTKPCSISQDKPVTLQKPVETGGTLHLKYDLDQGFPLGSVTRTIEIRSPQLAAPATVTFQVTKRLTPMLIPVIVLAGLLLGWLTNTALPGLIAWAHRERTRRTLLGIVQQLMPDKKNPGTDEDPLLTADLEPIKSALSVRNLSDADLTIQQTALEAALTAARARLNNARATATASQTLIAGTWLLPNDIAAALAEVRKSIDNELAAVRDNKLATAGRAADETAQWLKVLVEQIGEWRRSYRATLEEVQEVLSPYSADERVESLAAAIARELPVSTDDPQDARVGLQDVNARMINWNISLRPEFLHLVDSLSVISVADKKDLTDAMNNQDPAASLKLYAGVLGRLLAAPEDHLLAMALAVDGGATAGTAPSNPAPAGESQTISLASLYALAPGLSLSPGRAAVFNSIGWLAQIVRYAILVVLVSAVAFAVGESAWVGSWDQWFIVFGWAFAADLSVAGVTGMFGTGAKLPTLTPAA